MQYPVFATELLNIDKINTCSIDNLELYTDYILYGPDQNILSVYKHVYESNHNKMLLKRYTKGNAGYEETLINYDLAESGDVLKSTSINQNNQKITILYEYNELGQLNTKTWFTDDQKISSATYSFDQHGNVDKIESHYFNMEDFSDGLQLCINEYDSQDFLIQRELYFIDRNGEKAPQASIYYTYEYDMDGQLLRIQQLDSKNKIKTTTVFYYEGIEDEIIQSLFI